MQYKITTYSEDDTIELAQNIESEKFPNMVICLIGDLGSGKTVFAKAFAKALGTTPGKLMGLAENDYVEKVDTLAAHFSGDEYTESELDEIRQFAAFVKNKRK